MSEKVKIPKLYFQKPRVREEKRHIGGREVIRYGFATPLNPGPGEYAITRGLEAYFIQSGKSDRQAEFVCKVDRDAEKPFDQYENQQRMGRHLWTPVEVQRSLEKLYKILRKDWEARCIKKKCDSDRKPPSRSV